MLDRWIKCTGGDYRYVRLEVDKDSEATAEDLENWFRIYNEFIVRYGLSKTYIEFLKCMKKLAQLEIKYAKSILSKEYDDSIQTFINIQEVKLEALKKKLGDGMSIEETLSRLSKFQGYPIRTHETTFIQYQNILEDYGRAGKAA